MRLSIFPVCAIRFVNYCNALRICYAKQYSAAGGPKTGDKVSRNEVNNAGGSPAGRQRELQVKIGINANP